VIPVSRLLYAEHHGAYLQRKYLTSVGSGITLVLVILVLFVYPVIRGAEFDVGFLIQILFGAFISIYLVLWFIFPAFEAQRFEIYDDRIALPRPRETTLFGHKPETIMKSDIQSAEYQSQEVGGWGYTLKFKNGEVFYLNWVFVDCNECEPSMREFLRELIES
jgi:hypothetical protein